MLCKCGKQDSRLIPNDNLKVNLVVTFLSVRGLVWQRWGDQGRLVGWRVQRPRAVCLFGGRRAVSVRGGGRLEGGVPRVALVVYLGDVASVRVDVVLDRLYAAVRQKYKVFPLGAVGVSTLRVAEIRAGVVVSHVVRKTVVDVVLERWREEGFH